MPPEPRRHFGILSLTGTGHLLPFLSLAHELLGRGHRVTFFGKPKAADLVLRAGFAFVPLAAKNSAFQRRELPTRSGIIAAISDLRLSIRQISAEIHAFLNETPVALSESAVDAIIIDEFALTGPTIAQLMSLPYFIVSTSVPHRFGWNKYPHSSAYQYSSSILAWLQRLFLEVSVFRMRGPIRRLLDRERRQLGLRPASTIRHDSSCLAHITQLPAFLAFENEQLPINFYYTGPFSDDSARPQIAFPWKRLDGRPLIYASLGTTRNVQPFILRLIAEACQDLDVQLVISLGNRFDPEQFHELPGQPLVVKYAPQPDILKIARLVITHGGANTVFESLIAGKPMLVIPLAFDQPALAARLVYLRVAETLPIPPTAKRIRAALIKLLNESAYQDSAAMAQAKMQALHGAELAAQIIEDRLAKFSIHRKIDFLRRPETEPSVLFPESL